MEYFYSAALQLDYKSFGRLNTDTVSRKLPAAMFDGNAFSQKDAYAAPFFDNLVGIFQPDSKIVVKIYK
jgi:hypothetical protein